MRELTVPCRLHVGATAVTDLTQDLQYRLERAGMPRADARKTVEDLPPAGQHELCTELRDNPNGVQELGHTHPSALAMRLLVDFLTADEIRARLLAVAR